MKTRSKEEMTAYKREWRKRKAAVTPSRDVTPSASHPAVPSVTPLADVAPVAVSPATACSHCIAKDQEIARLTAQVGALVASQAQVDPVKATDTSLYEGITTAKVGRFTRCDTGRTIGTARV